MGNDKFTWRQARLLNVRPGTHCAVINHAITGDDVELFWFEETGLTPIGQTLFVFTVRKEIKAIYSSESLVDKFIEQHEIPIKRWENGPRCDGDEIEIIRQKAIAQFQEKEQPE